MLLVFDGGGVVVVGSGGVGTRDTGSAVVGMRDTALDGLPSLGRSAIAVSSATWAGLALCHGQ